MKSDEAAFANRLPPVVLSSAGVVLIYGCDAVATEAGRLLESSLDVSVLIRSDCNVVPSEALEFPVARGQIRSAGGHLGAFELIIDRYAAPSSDTAPSTLSDGAASRCDIILDLSGGTPLFSAPDLRDGYVRADPRHREAWLDAVSLAKTLVGTFEKPRYIDFTASRCAHSRSEIIGCTRCLDVCPANAITPAQDHVSIDPYICAGCGQCAAVCPTGAATYALPHADELMRSLRADLISRRQATLAPITVLVHDVAYGSPLLGLLQTRDGLPDGMVPLAVNEVTQIGLEVIMAAFLYGAAAVRLLVRARPRHDIAALRSTIALAESLLLGLGFGSSRIALVETDDPDELGVALQSIPTMTPAAQPAAYVVMGANKAAMRRKVLQDLHRMAPTPVDVLPLGKGSPFGSVEVNVEGCTLCLSCVSACPTGALRDNDEQPMLRFTEDACIQCGLCQATCPESVISLTPQLDFRVTTAAPRILKTESPFCCVRCGKPFGVKSTIDRVLAKLADTHWMFKGSSQRLELIKMCDTCRVAAVSEQDLDPYAPPRPAVRTTDDYLRERAALPDEDN
jgi:ferredoxin